MRRTTEAPAFARRGALDGSPQGHNPRMLTVNKLLPGGRGLAPALVRRAPAVELDWDLRQKSRFDCTDGTGRRLGVSLPSGRALRGGDVLVAEDGSLLRVVAAPQPLLSARVAAGRPALDLLRAAYRLGERHVPLELQPDRLRLAPDPVLAELLRAMGLEVAEERAPFEPEGGTCGSGDARHAHDHGHDCGHGHRHAHGKRPSAEAAAAPVRPPARGRPVGIPVAPAPAPHVHGPGCGHDHEH